MEDRRPVQRLGHDLALAVVLPHLQAAYRRGLMAGRSQAGYRGTRNEVHLKGRQLEVAVLAAHGLTHADIGRRLGLTEDTVKVHMRNALRTAGVKRRSHLAALMAAQGHVTPRKEEPCAPTQPPGTSASTWPGTPRPAPARAASC